MRKLTQARIRPYPIAVIAIVMMCGVPTSDAAGQIAVSDTVAVVAGRTARVDVLANDLRAGIDSVSVDVVVPPHGGSIAWDSTGGLLYEPDSGFVGLDSLVYRLQVVPAGLFEIDTVASVVDFAADLAIPNLGSASDNTGLRVSGHIRAVLWPGSSAIDSVSVIGLEMSNLDAASLAFDYGDLGVTVLTVNAGVASSDLRLTLLKGGPSAIPGFAGLFTQVSNELGVAGTIQISGSGALGAQVPAGVQEFDTSTSGDLAGLVGASGDSSLVILNLDLAQSVDLAGNDADLRITGEIVARGRVSPAGFSGHATVYFEVVSGLATEVLAAAELGVYPNPSTGLVRLSSASAVWSEVAVFDMLGRRIVSVRGDAGESQIDLSAQAPGLYLLRWQSQTGQTGSRSLMLVR
ncbi:MAG: hypothetical protein ACI9W4_002483 [Rhodothermales bacterium]|jgi:hypothetical protein